MDASDATSTAKDASARNVDSAVDTAGLLDVARAAALAKALEAFVEAGLLDHARPLARELADVLRAADGEAAPVVVLAAERSKRS
jgi:hypothetical protein